MITLSSWTREIAVSKRLTQLCASIQVTCRRFTTEPIPPETSSIYVSKVPKTYDERPTDSLPVPYGPLTKRIRDLYAVDILCRTAKALALNYYQDYTCPARKLHGKANEPMITIFWGTFLRFCECYGEFFEISRNGQNIRSKMPPEFELNEVAVLRALDAVMPEKSSMKLESFAKLLHQSKLRKVHALMLSSDAIAEKYAVVKNADNVVFIRRVVDAEFFDAWCYLGGNKPVAYCLEAAAQLLPALPDFWIPYDACLAHVHDSTVIKSRNFFRVADVLDYGIEQAEYGFMRTLYVRRATSLKKHTDLPQCAVTHTLSGFHVTPLRALKIAFCLPSGFVSVPDAHARMFPSVIEWAQTTAYSLSEVVMMYPKVMCISQAGHVKSLLRGSYSALAPDEKATFDSETETRFMESLEKDPDTKRKLLALVEEPSRNVFPDARSFHDKSFYKVQEKILKEKVVQGGAIFSDEAILREAVKYVDDIALPVSELTVKIADGLPQEKQKAFKRTFYARHDGKIDRLIEKYPQFDLVAYQERIEGSNQYSYYVAKKSSQVAEGNSFLEPENLTREIEFQARSFLESKTRVAHITKRVEISNLIACLPKKARLAIRQFGGFVKFITQYPGEIEIIGETFLRLRRK